MFFMFATKSHRNKIFKNDKLVHDIINGLLNGEASLRGASTEGRRVASPTIITSPSGRRSRSMRHPIADTPKIMKLQNILGINLNQNFNINELTKVSYF